MILRIGIVVSDSRRSADRSLAISVHVPRKPKARRELPPVAVPAALSLKSGISRKGEAQRSFLKHRAFHACRPGRIAIFRDSPEGQRFGKVGFLMETVINSLVLIHFPAVCCVDFYISFPLVVGVRSGL